MVTARVVGLAVAEPRLVSTRAGDVLTSIFKEPVFERRWVGLTNIAGDRQADLSVHGGVNKAVYVYPHEHYEPWRRALGVDSLDAAAFGENLTTTGLVEDDVCIGDRFQIGSAEFVVTQPRTPCFKLALRFGRSDMVHRFAEADRSGFYLAVEREGELGVGDAVVVLSRDERRLTVADTYRLRLGRGTHGKLQIAASHPALSEGWREKFQRMLSGGPVEPI